MHLSKLTSCAMQRPQRKPEKKTISQSSANMKKTEERKCAHQSVINFLLELQLATPPSVAIAPYAFATDVPFSMSNCNRIEEIEN